MIPQTYEEWRHCITEECKIPLTIAYVTERLSVWRNEALEETRRFRRLYGDRHWMAVQGWFQRALGEMG